MCMIGMGAPDLLPRPCPGCGAAMDKTREPGEETGRLLRYNWTGSFRCGGCGREFRIAEVPAARLQDST